MGMRGKRPNSRIEEPVLFSPKREHNTDAHRCLCLLAAKFIHRRGSIDPPSCPFVVIELVTCEQETPDVFGWNYWTTVLVEVKVSRSDFLADKKKWFWMGSDCLLFTQNRIAMDSSSTLLIVVDTSDGTGSQEVVGSTPTISTK